MKKFQIVASYEASFFSRKIDNLIEKSAGAESTGSGCGFGERDITFVAKTLEDAKTIKRKVKKVCTKFPQISLHVEIYRED